MGRWILGISILGLAAGCSGEGSEGDDEGGAENTLELCTDGVDNGDDGVQAYVDCRDADCRPFAEDCAPPVWDPDERPSDFSCLHDNPPDPPGEGTVTIRVYAEDFEDDVRIQDGFTVDVYFDNAYGGDESDVQATAAAGEELSDEIEVPAGQLVAYRFRAIPGRFKETIEYDVRTPDADGGEMRTVTVKESTYNVIPATLGIRIESGKGIIAGEFGDCSGEPVANAIARVIPDDPGIQVRYFVDEFPSREPVTTTEDGLWGAINVPPGEVTVEIWGRLAEDADLELLGRHGATVVADSINVIDIPPLEE